MFIRKLSGSKTPINTKKSDGLLLLDQLRSLLTVCFALGRPPNSRFNSQDLALSTHLKSQQLFLRFLLIKVENGFYLGAAGLYKGLVPLWSRQVPYTIVKFVAFEWFVQQFYDNIFTQPKETYSKGTQLGITFASGYLAGIFCAIVSHPADTMVSKLYSQGQEAGSTMEKVGKIYAQIGFKGLWAGLITRIIMIGTLTGLQWWIYDSFKVSVGLASTGGGSAKKVA